MNIRLLTAEESELAAELAAVVFHACLEPDIPYPELVTQFYNYINPPELKKQVASGELYLWGAFTEKSANGITSLTMTGVCGLTSTGLITMLYVLPGRQHQKIGRKLLMTMRKYGRIELGMKQIYVNAAPAYTAAYFERFGFSRIDYRQNPRGLYLSLSAPTVYIKDAPRKKVPSYVLLPIALGFTAAALASGVLYVLLYFAG